MPDFMVMILENEAETLTPAETRALIEGHSAYAQKLRARNAYLDGERLRPAKEAKRVRRSNGRVEVDSGPFAEASLAGYYLLRAENLDAAVKLAEECPRSPGSALDVRPLMKGKCDPDKSNQQGRVFAFAVTGSAPNEPAWVEIMDRIDAEGSDGIPLDRRLGGVRLLPPGRGRRVTKQAIIDGPFLESKEVIGGLLFLRMASMDEAVEWAAGSAFVKHGALEIRELWRS